jgi:hypothetical protein
MLAQFPQHVDAAQVGQVHVDEGDILGHMPGLFEAAPAVTPQVLPLHPRCKVYRIARTRCTRSALTGVSGGQEARISGGHDALCRGALKEAAAEECGLTAGITHFQIAVHSCTTHISRIPEHWSSRPTQSCR